MNTDEKFEQTYSKILKEDMQSLQYKLEGSKSETIINIVITIFIIIVIAIGVRLLK